MKSNVWMYTAVCCCLLGSVSAAAPNMAYFPAYTTVDESTFYVQGGSNFISGEVYTQFYALDLTQSWNTSTPLWKEVATVGPFPERLKAVWHSLSVSKDQKSLTFWDMNKAPTYSIGFRRDNGTWVDMAAPPPLKPADRIVCKAVTDPTTDRVYIPGGAAGGDMLVYDPVFKNTTTVAMPAGRNSTGWTYYTFAWNAVRRSFLLYGGMMSTAELENPGLLGPVLYEYSPAAATPWVALNSSGAVPRMLSGSCMVSAHNGTKMIIYGGSYGLTVSGNLYILDVATMSWKQGPSAQPRVGMACSVSGDNFIVWGGISWDNIATPIQLPNTPMVLNINTTQWTDTFVTKFKPITTTTTTTTATATATKPVETGHSGAGDTDKGAETSNQESSNKVAIIGGSVGGGILLLLLIAGGVFFCLRRRRVQQQQQQKGKEMQEEEPTKRTQFRIVQQPPTDETLEPTFYPSRPFRITPNTSHNNSNNKARKKNERKEREDSWNAPSDWSSSPTQSVDSFSTPSTSTLDASNNPNATNTTLLPQHYITLKPSQRARQR